MIWLALSLALLMAAWLAAARDLPALERLARPAFAVSLLVWFWLSARPLSLPGGDAALLRWFAWGLGLFAIAEVLRLTPPSPSWVGALPPLSALLYALGLDILRPDAYAFVPAILIAALVLLVALRVLLQLRGRLKVGLPQVMAALGVLSNAALVYVAMYKLLDRGWQLPWSYIVAAGAFAFALAQLWIAGKNVLARPTPAPAAILLSMLAGHFFIIVAAFYHYQQFL